MKQESQPQKYLRLYRWLKLQGYSPKLARFSALGYAGYSYSTNYVNYWKYR